jgi:hypothetical protein
VAGGAAEVHQAAAGEQRDALAVGEDELINLGLDVLFLDLLVALEPGDLDLAVEVADVGEDRLVLHRQHVLAADDVAAAGGGDEDVGDRRGVLHRHDLVALHRGLQRADGIDLGDEHAGAEAARGVGAALADVAVAGDDDDLAGDHHVGGALDAVEQRLAATVEVVELRLGDRVVDVDAGEQQLALLGHVVEAVHAGGGLLGDALDLGGQLGEAALVGLEALVEDRQHDAPLLVGRGRRARRGAGLLELDALVDEQREIAAVVEDHVGAEAALEGVQLQADAGPVLLEVLALPREHRDAGLGDRRGGLVLGRVDVARGPGDLGAEGDQGLDEDRGLDRHVQAAGDARALERLLALPYSARSAIRPGISFSAMRIFLRPSSARAMSLILNAGNSVRMSI